MIRALVTIILTCLGLHMTPCLATERDQGADMVVIATRFIAVHDARAGTARNADEPFIEDRVIPAVHAMVERDGGRLTQAQLQALIDFMIVADGMASEEISEMAATLYRKQGPAVCTLLKNTPATRRSVVIARIRSGIAPTGARSSAAVCR
ncbi:hypothetical protein [Stenotrophomonas maltophilia]|uniref:hypothetical protein n=1 Tax=Stenotrophomonas maltophilia TaxID=40324 RepID=UPI0013DC17D3|nr:hypothetical protein [Stenotrophomonas maltophilia]